MTTSSTPAKPFTSAALDACIGCGYCLPACPTYQITGDEASSPRGRINLMKAVQSGTIDVADPIAVEQSSQCLGCRACEPVCPAAVPYGLLIEEWRDAAWKHKPLKLRGLMAAVKWETPLRIGGVVRRVANQPDASAGEHLMLGCFERMLYPQLSQQVVDLYPHIAVSHKQGCCGALHAHNGDLEQGTELGTKLGNQLDGTIVTTSGGCAAHTAAVIGRDRIVEISEYLAANPPSNLTPIRRHGRTARIAIQDSCHLRNGLGVVDSIRQVVARVGDLVELQSAASCCGAAGSYSVLRPSDASAVFDRKHAEIEEADIDIIAVVNPGCYRQVTQQVRKRSGTEVKHLVELVHEAARH